MNPRADTPRHVGTGAGNLGAGLEGQGVLVTGAAGGIGQATAHLFAECGARVMAVDLDEPALRQLADALPGEGHVAAAYDVTDTASHPDLMTRAIDELGSLRAMAHLAAVLNRAELADVTEAGWDAQTDVNLKATFFLCRSAGEAMRSSGTGSIVTVVSQGAWTGGHGGSVVYNMAKGGVVTMTRGMARTFGPDGIRVNAVSPGHINTPMLTTDLRDELRDQLVAATPLGRLGEPDEVAPAVVFLASDHASFITGATVNVSGGFLMH